MTSGLGRAHEPGVPGAPLGAARLLVVVLGLVVAMGPAPSAGAVADQSAPPTVEASSAAVRTGQDVTVTVRHWPEGVTNVELCGNGLRQGSADCDVLGGVAVAVPATGGASVRFTVGDPPGGCPCVLRASQVGGRTVATADLVVTNAPTAAAADPAAEDGPRRELEVEGIRTVRSHTWPALFGAGADRTLKLTVRNTGSAPVAAPVLSVSFTGRAGTPGEVVEATTLDPIEPGDEQRVELTFTLPALSMGDQAIEGRIDGGDEPVTFAEQTGTTPWGLVILAGLGAYLLVLRGVVAVLSRRRRRQALTTEVPGPEPAGAGIVPAATGPGPTGSMVRWDAFGGVTVGSVLSALIDAGAPIQVLDRTLATVDLPGCRLEVSEVAADQTVRATTARFHLDRPDQHYDRSAVNRLLERSELDERTRRQVLSVLAVLADATASVQQVPPEQSTTDGQTLASIIACCVALETLAITHGTCGPISIGHGRPGDEALPEPVPDPVTAELLRRHQLPWRTGPWPGARCTPAGVAVLAATSSSAPAPASQTIATAIGYAATTDGEGSTVSFRVLVCEAGAAELDVDHTAGMPRAPTSVAPLELRESAEVVGR